jgi:hypothetical protein
VSLENKIKQILNDFDNAESELIIELLTLIQPHLKSEITRDYLKGKIHAITETHADIEKKKLCNNLKPYFDWYLQGI